MRETVDATLREVMRCTRENIRINTFMLDPSLHLQRFVEKLTELNRGRAFFTTPETLGDYVLVDFIEQQARAAAGRSRRAAEPTRRAIESRRARYSCVGPLVEGDQEDPLDRCGRGA